MVTEQNNMFIHNYLCISVKGTDVNVDKAIAHLFVRNRDGDKRLCTNNNDNNNNNKVWHLYSALTDTVQIRQYNYVATANQHKLQRSKTQKRTYYGLGNRWLSHDSFAQFSNEPWRNRSLFNILVLVSW